MHCTSLRPYSTQNIRIASCHSSAAFPYFPGTAPDPDPHPRPLVVSNFVIDVHCALIFTINIWIKLLAPYSFQMQSNSISHPVSLSVGPFELCIKKYLEIQIRLGDFPAEQQGFHLTEFESPNNLGHRAQQCQCQL